MSITLPDERASLVASPEAFERLLADLTGLDEALSPDVLNAVSTVIEHLGSADTVSIDAITTGFYGRMNQKLGINKDGIASLYAACAAEGATFNYPTKRRIEWAINTGNIGDLQAEMARVDLAKALPSLRVLTTPASHSETRARIVAEAASPSKLRKQPARMVAGDVFNAAAGPLAWSIWSPARMSTVFSTSPMPFTVDYMTDLRRHLPDLFERRRSLVVRQVRPAGHVELADQRAQLTTWIAEEYAALDNYGFLAVIVNVDEGREAEAWQLASDLPLFAERFLEVELKQMFFRWRDVRKATLEHNRGVRGDDARFELLNEGFTYRDTFVLYDDSDAIRRLVLILQKNQRDETRVPCPGCRSDNVGGNSYPSFGVKSWECLNPLCTDRSIYNRGKRYDFRALIKQEAIEKDGNQIPIESVRRWQRDILPFMGDPEILDTLVAHYSMLNDVVVLIDVKDSPTSPIGRDIQVGAEPVPCLSASPSGTFWSSAFFARFIPSSIGGAPRATSVATDTKAPWSVIHGDALDVLRRTAESTFDRAVTSPPYYNAREYAQWPNLYCYMHDMYLIAREVFRTLKPGAIYAYNIFDYFDNERVVTFSDMGKKRILLSALMVDSFRRIGFEYLGSSVWDKGDIQGKRGFNAGNFSPFYQAPFNCWEHVLVVRKPGDGADLLARGRMPALNQPLRIHPVVKMIRGKNTLGHTAPYPLGLVSSLLVGLAPGSHVLDPFGGSGTTARAALSAGHTSLLIERDSTYSELSRRLIAEHEEAAAHQDVPDAL
ncbi:DNA methyltransferase [Cellulosimicrobium sp. PMB13]|uniref:DNA-methyltransferase n=1 Tax=Cellulosimicrobium sp. PMB13 TaxID=3120158 RepID=UPI003F4C8E7D